MDGQRKEDQLSIQRTLIKDAIHSVIQERLVYDQQLNIEAIDRITKTMTNNGNTLSSTATDIERRNLEYALHTYMFDLVQQLPTDPIQPIQANPTDTADRNTSDSDSTGEGVFWQVLALIDIASVLSDVGSMVDPSLAFTLVEEAMDMVSIVVAQEVFKHLERRAQLLRRNISATGGKGIVMLKMCNNLLRRIPHSTMSQFAGRVQTFVANSFPLSERSGVNLRGDFDQTNLPILPALEDEDENDDNDNNGNNDIMVAEGGGNDGRSQVKADRDLYQAFWSLQEYFANPQKLTDTQPPDNNSNSNNEYSVEKFVKAATVTIDEFRKTITSKTQSLALLEPTGTETLKYLTAPTLLRMQFADSLFKCQVLLQLLIFIKYVLSMSGDRLETLKKTATNKFVLGGVAISSADEKALRDLRKRASGQLVGAANDRGVFSRTSQFVLFHENSWSRWKAESCKPFEKQLDGPQETELLEELRVSAQLFLDAPRNQFMGFAKESELQSGAPMMGSKRLADLWTVKIDSADLEGLGREVRAMDLLAAMGRLDLYCRDDADYDMLTASEQERADVLQWRALRSSVFDNMFRNVNPSSKSLSVLRDEVFPKDEMEEEEDEEEQDNSAPTNGNRAQSPMEVES
ncbi:hypothetical protein IWW48_002031 [Coemansia sp. RSA 1200]|nr:hypothetical protein IWW48_002031 [Coemansia sp. RSA 1200]